MLEVSTLYVPAFLRETLPIWIKSSPKMTPSCSSVKGRLLKNQEKFPSDGIGLESSASCILKSLAPSLTWN